MTKRVDLAQDSGKYEPQITLRMPEPANARVLRAEAYRLAAEIELATHADEEWVVCVETVSNAWGTHARVYLLLTRNTQDEVVRGFEFLRWIAGVG